MTTDLFIELLERKLQEENPRAVIERLDDLLVNARRGLELRERFVPKIGRKYLLRPNVSR